jgi:hypothetical protein
MVGQPPAIVVHVSHATLRFRVTARGRGGTLRFVERVPRWPERTVFGSPLAFGQPRLHGAGRLGVTAGQPDFAFGACVRGGAGPQVQGMDLRLRAHDTTTIVQRVRLTRRAWPGTRYRPRVTAYWHGRPRRLAIPRLRVHPRRGVHIRLTSDPPLDQSKFSPRLPAGRSVVVGGSTDPVLRRATIRLEAVRPAAPALSLGDAVTDGQGRFALAPWQPPPGDYMVVARHAGRLADSACDLHFSVR